MAIQKQSFSWLFSSNPLLGATSKTPDGSQFTAILPEAFQLPQNASNIQICVNSATLWFNQWNLTEDNNQFKYVRQGFPVLQTLVIPPGLYSFDELSAQLYSQLSAINITNYRLVANQPNQRVYESFTTSATGIIRTEWPLGTFGDVCGFDVGRVTVFPNVAAAAYSGDKTAKFNAIDYFLVQSTLVSKGIRTNGKYLGVIAQVPINGPPGSELLYEPQNPVFTPASELAGNAVSQVTTLLTDSNNVPVNTRGENYTVGVVITWQVPIYQ